MLDITQGLTILIISIVFAFLIAFPIIKLLYKFNITRRGEADFSNLIDAREKKVGTPIMGGLIVIIAVVVLNLLLNVDESGTVSGSIKIPLLIFIISALLGGVDDVLNIYGKPRKVIRIRRTIKLIKVHKDILKRVWYVVTLPWIIYKRIFNILGSNPGKGIHAHEKILIQTLSGLVLSIWLLFGTGWAQPDLVWIPFIGNISFGYFIIPFAIFTLVSMSNSVNLTDGMDGLAAGILISSFGGFLAISIATGNQHITILLLTLIGSLLTYLYFNIPPARFQMGDVGSLSLGAILTVVAFELRVPFLLLIIGFPFVAEIASSLIQSISRRVFGRRILDMAPLHHHFEMKGWNEEKVVMRFWLFGIISSILGTWVYFMFV